MTRQQKSAGKRGGAKRGAGEGPRGPSQRQLRVGEEMRHALSRIIARDELNDPDLAHLSVTITAVDMSPDLRNALAYVVPFGIAVNQAGSQGVDTAVMIKALNRAAAFFRGQLSREVDLRMSPTLRFRLDESFEQANRIEALLHDPLVARDLGPQGDAADEAATATDGDDDGAA
ncbi:MAG TPA: 30S ribosome-binding factor RbfA [Dongiaceae bacterium]|nr:30S ribosome-binding factor RbfA [Dongiaceae bacterium]